MKYGRNEISSTCVYMLILCITVYLWYGIDKLIDIDSHRVVNQLCCFVNLTLSRRQIQLFFDNNRQRSKGNRLYNMHERVIV